MKKTRVISAYPCCGKTWAYENLKDKYSILDSDSSKFSWLFDDEGVNTHERNPDFPANYIQDIKDNIGKVDYIFVSTHLAVREALEKAGIDFVTVYPKDSAKEEWLERMKNRGNYASFIETQSRFWNERMGEIENEPHGSELFRLGGNEYLSDLM